MEFLVLGTVEIVVDGRVLPLGGTRERAVLARLLLAPRQVVAKDTLLAQLWPEAPPERGGSAALQAYVHRLRKVLRRGSEEELLCTRAPGYLLAVEPDAVDAVRFEVRVREGERNAADGRHQAAADAFAAALSLWRGPAYDGIDDLPFAAAEAARLAEARLGALEGRIEADLACGRDRELIGELANLTEAHPLRERLWAARMTALYRAGRQAEALRAYQDVRTLLDDELGLEPSAPLRALEGAILRQDLAPAVAPARTVAVQAAPSPDPPVVEVASSAPPPSGVVTFVFTDVVGSTELLDRLGDDAADALRRRHFAALRQIVRSHDGTEVKNLGDGLMVAFASPASAVRAAVEIQRITEGPAVRVGVHAGEPTAEEDDFFGTPVVIAQRLCARAEGGQVLASALVQALVGTRAGCTFEPLGGLMLKGLAAPVEAAAVRWIAPEPAPALALPGALAVHDSAFVRPESDMARLEAAWANARSGRRQVVLLGGEPGIGKTRRCAELARTVHQANATVLHGRCEDGLNVPYQPFVEALGGYLRAASEPVLGRLGGELTRLVPELALRFPDLPDPLSADPETERLRLYDAVAAWLAALAEDAPTLLIVEDLHWASAPTLGMLTHLVRSGEPGRLLVVANHRDTAIDFSPALQDAVVDLVRQPDVERLSLTGLDRTGVGAFLAGRGANEPEKVVELLYTETGGNPFYLGELVRHLAETGGWDPGRVPENVRDVIAQRVGRLSEPTRDLLALAAIQGERFDPGVLTRAAARPYVEVLRALDDAVAARLVTDQHRFVHALVRHTVVDGLGTATRMELHRATGAALAALVGEEWREHAADLARHALAATPPVGADPDEVRRTLDYAEAAADRAAAALAYEEAAALLARALPLSRGGVPAQRARMLVALGEAQHHAGDPAHRVTLRDAAAAALAVGDALLAARAAVANERPVTVLGKVDSEQLALYRSVLDALGSEPSPARARVLAALGRACTTAATRRTTTWCATPCARPAAWRIRTAWRGCSPLRVSPCGRWTLCRSGSTSPRSCRLWPSRWTIRSSASMPASRSTTRRARPGISLAPAPAWPGRRCSPTRSANRLRASGFSSRNRTARCSTAAGPTSTGTRHRPCTSAR
ncbi:MAG: BTAD domain-containing putative transcriptional regulator [Sporichthyaceae bacterium]